MKYIRKLSKSEEKLFNRYYGTPHKGPEVRSGVYMQDSGKLVALVTKGPMGVYAYTVEG